MESNKQLAIVFILKMIAREWLAHRHRLLLIAGCIAVGTASFMTMTSFSNTVKRSLEREARQILGGDISVTQSGRRLSREVIDVVRSVPGVAASVEVIDTQTMIEVEGERAQLAELRAIGDGYPLAGSFELTEQTENWNQGVLVESDLAKRWQLKPGSEMRVGGNPLRVTAVVSRDSTRISGAFRLGPRIYLTSDLATRLGIVSEMSRVRGSLHLRLSREDTVEQSKLAIQNLLRERKVTGLRVMTHSEAASSAARPLRNMNIFLSQLGIAILLLTIAGGWISLLVYLASQNASIAVLRCLGATPRTVSAIYAGVTSICVLLAWAFGFFVSNVACNALPTFLMKLLPGGLVAQGCAWPSGTDFLLSFAIVFFLVGPAVLGLQKVSPLQIFRANTETTGKSRLLNASLYCIAFLLSAILVIRFSPSKTVGLVISASLGVVVLSFSLLESSLRHAFIRVQHKLALAIRIALANVVSRKRRSGFILGLISTAVLLSMTLDAIQYGLVTPITAGRAITNKPNVFLADVQSDQLEDVTKLLGEHAKNIESAPFVRARLSSINKVTVQDPERVSPNDLPIAESENTLEESANRLKTREQNLTYRFELSPYESIEAGTFWASSNEERAEVSLEKRFAERIGATLGDELEFDVQGVTIRAKVTSLRKVEWQSLRPNFFIVAHPSLLRDAPQIHIVAAHFQDSDAVDAFQRAVLSKFGNITVIDVTEVARTVENILDTIGIVVRVFSIFLIISALLLLVAGLVASLPARSREIAVLRVLGANRATLNKSIVFDAFFLGFSASVGGALLSLLVSNTYGEVVFDISPEISVMRTLAYIVAVTLFTTFVGALVSMRSVARGIGGLLRERE